KIGEERMVVVGTHGTALSSILHYYDNRFNCDSFLRILDWMPYIIELDFEEEVLVGKIEHLHIEKEFDGIPTMKQ
ncbi:MAG: 2,3-bisphosphoglycerate-dependent phosphoglycerate mutase, partial [Clostridiales bacterium]|nr:2,3-bisphosphoglycerate-dependent phosphoglycerate mutase [Clostridiales bacterium]